FPRNQPAPSRQTPWTASSSIHGFQCSTLTPASRFRNLLARCCGSLHSTVPRVVDLTPEHDKAALNLADDPLIKDRLLQGLSPGFTGARISPLPGLSGAGRDAVDNAVPILQTDAMPGSAALGGAVCLPLPSDCSVQFDERHVMRFRGELHLHHWC